MSLDPVMIGRWQFGITTVYHFLMVPLTIGLGLMVALMQTQWVRTGDEKWLRMTRFWGKLFLINFIMGVATGIVQEFQFGMAWSEYSRFVGDVFGAPLAMEALIAFFAESTFLGLWIFGWKKLPPKLHLATLWAAVIGATISAYFIIVANSWMQHPVGIEFVDGRPRMNDIWAVLTNNTAILAYAHVITGALAVAASFLIGIAWYHLWLRRKNGIDTVGDDHKVVIGESSTPGRDRTDHGVWMSSLRIGISVGIVAFLLIAITGDLQAKLMYEQQPMKMASAEAACHSGTDFSILSISSPGSNDCENVKTLIKIPGLLGFLANGNLSGDPVPGVKALIPQYETMYGTNLPDDPILGDRAGQKIDYQPLMIVTYWGFRLMIGFGVVAAIGSAIGWWLSRNGTVPKSSLWMKLAVWAIFAPFAANIAGWVFTEMGRQPFVVVPNPDPSGIDGVWMFTAAAISPSATNFELMFSLIALTLIYAVLLVVEVWLITKYVKGGVVSAMPELVEGTEPDDDTRDVLAFAY